MVTASVGAGRVPLKPLLTYTNVLARSPLLTSRVSTWLVPLQAGSWLMSIFAGLGAVPVYFTTPLTLPTVLWSMAVVWAGAAAGCAASLAAVSFLLQADNNISPIAAMASIANHLLFMSPLSVKVLDPIQTRNFTANRHCVPTPRRQRRSARRHRLFPTGQRAWQR